MEYIACILGDLGIRPRVQLFTGYLVAFLSVILHHRFFVIFRFYVLKLALQAPQFGFQALGIVDERAWVLHVHTGGRSNKEGRMKW